MNARGRLSLVVYLYLPQVLVDGCQVLMWMSRELHACWEGVMQEESSWMDARCSCEFCHKVNFFNYQYDPQSLCQLAQTCRNLRVKCRSDEIWEPLFYDRWGKIIGPTAFTAWEQIVKGENARILNRSYMPSCLWMVPLTNIYTP